MKNSVWRKIGVLILSLTMVMTSLNLSFAYEETASEQQDNDAAVTEEIQEEIEEPADSETEEEAEVLVDEKTIVNEKSDKPDIPRNGDSTIEYTNAETTSGDRTYLKLEELKAGARLDGKEYLVLKAGSTVKGVEVDLKITKITSPITVYIDENQYGDKWKKSITINKDVIYNNTECNDLKKAQYNVYFTTAHLVTIVDTQPGGKTYGTYVKNNQTGKVAIPSGLSRTGYTAALYSDDEFKTVYNSASTPVTAAQTVYIGWSPVKYNTVLHSEYGLAGGTQIIECTYDNELNLSEHKLEKPGFELLGWSESEGGEVKYLTTDKIKNKRDASNANTAFDLYAVWKDLRKTTSISVTGGKGETSDDPLVVNWHSNTLNQDIIRSLQLNNVTDGGTIDDETLTLDTYTKPDRDATIPVTARYAGNTSKYYSGTFKIIYVKFEDNLPKYNITVSGYGEGGDVTVYGKKNPSESVAIPTDLPLVVTAAPKAGYLTKLIVVTNKGESKTFSWSDSSGEIAADNFDANSTYSVTVTFIKPELKLASGMKVNYYSAKKAEKSDDWGDVRSEILAYASVDNDTIPADFFGEGFATEVNWKLWGEYVGLKYKLSDVHKLLENRNETLFGRGLNNGVDLKDLVANLLKGDTLIPVKEGNTETVQVIYKNESKYKGVVLVATGVVTLSDLRTETGFRIKSNPSIRYYKGIESVKTDIQTKDCIFNAIVDLDSCKPDKDFFADATNYSRVKVEYLVREEKGIIPEKFIEIGEEPDRGEHKFGDNFDENTGEGTETIKITYKGNDDYKDCEWVGTLKLVDDRTATSILRDDFSMTYGENLRELMLADGKLSVVERDDTDKKVTFDNAQLTVTPEILNAGESQEVTVEYAGDYNYRPCKKTVKVTVNKAQATIDVEKMATSYDGDSHINVITTTPGFDAYNSEQPLDYLYVTVGVDTEVDGFVSVGIPYSTKISLQNNEKTRETIKAFFIKTGADEENAGKIADRIVDAISKAAKKTLGYNNLYDYLEAKIGDGVTLGELKTILGDADDFLSADVKDLLGEDVIKILEFLKIEVPEGSIGEMLGLTDGSFGMLYGIIKDLELGDGVKIAMGAGPKDAGAYLTTALLVDKNYTSDVDTNYLIIKQQGLSEDDKISLEYNAELNGDQWTLTDEEREYTALERALELGLISETLYENLGLDKLVQIKTAKTMTMKQADAFTWGGYLAKDGVKITGDKQYDEARIQKNVHTIYLGVTADGKPVSAKDKAPTKPGVYSEIVYVLMGNYIAKPLVRVYKIDRNPTAIDIKCNGTSGDDFTFTYLDEYEFSTVLTDTREKVALTDKKVSITYIGWDDKDTGLFSSEAPENAGVYLVTATFLGDDLYKPSVATAKLTIKRKDINPEVTLDDWYYGDEAATPEVTGNDGNGKVTYFYKKTTDSYVHYRTTVPTEAGEYDVLASVAKTRNYNENTATSTFTIKPRPVDISWGETSFVYNAEDQKPTCDISVYDDGESAFDPAIIGDDDLGASVVVQEEGVDVEHKNVGSYTAKAVLTGDSAGNYVIVDNETKEFKITPHDVKVTLADASIVYGTVLDPTADPEGLLEGCEVEGVQGEDEITINPFIAEKENSNYPKVGEYTISANVEEDSNYTFEVVDAKLTITERPVAIKWSKKKVFKYTGKEQGLTAEIVPYGEYDPAIVTIGDGPVDDVYMVMTPDEKEPGTYNASVTLEGEDAYCYYIVNPEAEFTILEKGVNTGDYNVLAFFGFMSIMAVAGLAIDMIRRRKENE